MYSLEEEQANIAFLKKKKKKKKKKEKTKKKKTKKEKKKRRRNHQTEYKFSSLYLTLQYTLNING